MGRYQQWLHDREVDQQLQAKLEILEKELIQLQNRASLLESVFPHAENEIIRLLATSLNGHATGSNHSTAPTKTPIPGTVANEPTAAISPEFFAWSSLPNFGPDEITSEERLEDTRQAISNEVDSLPPVPHSDMALLPNDLDTLIEKHTQARTEPQLEIPDWLRNITAPTATSPGTLGGPVDQESIRTNRLVERWLQRWGRPTSLQNKPGEAGENQL